MPGDALPPVDEALRRIRAAGGLGEARHRGIWRDEWLDAPERTRIIDRRYVRERFDAVERTPRDPAHRVMIGPILPLEQLAGRDLVSDLGTLLKWCKEEVQSRGWAPETVQILIRCYVWSEGEYTGIAISDAHGTARVPFELHFSYCLFLPGRGRHHPVDFRRMEFERSVFVSHCLFAQGLNAGRARFSEGLHMEQTAIEGPLCLADSSGALRLEGCRIEDLLDLENARLDRPLNLEGCGFGDAGRFRFLGATVDGVPIYDGNLVLRSNQVYRRSPTLLRGYGPGRAAAEDHRGNRRLLASAVHEYQALRDSFARTPGGEEGERYCHYRYMQLSRVAALLDARARAAEAPRWQRPLRLFRAHAESALTRLVGEWIFAYFVAPMRTFLWIPLSITIFAAMLSAGAILGRIDGIAPRPLAQAVRDTIYFSTITFTTVGYGDLRPLGWVRGVVCLEAIWGVVLVAAFVVALARRLYRGG